MTPFGPNDPAPTREQRIALSARVDRSAGLFGCWPFIGTPNEDGYMRLRVNGDVAYAHRVAYWMAVGPIPDDMFVCHTCDNPPCCNPGHHFLGTAADNTGDMVAKGRQPSRGKLSASEVEAIRSAPERGVHQWALSLGVSVRTIYRVLAADTYLDLRWARKDQAA